MKCWMAASGSRATNPLVGGQRGQRQPCGQQEPEAKLERWCRAAGARGERIRMRWQIIRKYFELQGEVQSGRARISVKHHSARFDSAVHFYKSFHGDSPMKCFEISPFGTVPTDST
jgi:hypothetical protein